MKMCLDGHWLLLLLFVACRAEIQDVGGLGDAVKVLQDLSVVLECDDSRVMHKVSKSSSEGRSRFDIVEIN